MESIENLLVKGHLNGQGMYLDEQHNTGKESLRDKKTVRKENRTQNSVLNKMF